MSRYSAIDPRATKFARLLMMSRSKISTSLHISPAALSLSKLSGDMTYDNAIINSRNYAIFHLGL